MAIAMRTEQEGALSIRILLPLFALGLFACCMVCHGELARLKPNPKYLTHFYLMISAGAKQNPDTKVIFMSGYCSTEISRLVGD